jgi:hypothetical protein
LGPEIVENYRDFTPPANFRKLLFDLLRDVPPKYLAGLKTVILSNKSALTRDQRKRKLWSRTRNIRMADALGSYKAAWRSAPASITLYVDNIVRREPGFIWKIPAVRYLPIASVVYHEIGHHIHAVHEPVYKGKEDVADYWSRRLGRAFFKRRYWYLIPVAVVVSWGRDFAKWIAPKKVSEP